jgi:hypothetical protein
MNEPLSHEHFAPYVGRQFSFEGQTITLLLRSIDVEPRFAAPGATRVPFTLVFEGPSGEILPPGFYHATEHDGAVFELYVTPIHTPVRDHQDYQAVFN